MDGLVAPAIRVALDALSDRQRAIARNVANIHTPGYVAQRVDFESALSDAIAAGPDASYADLAGVETTQRTSDPMRDGGSNVVLEDETLLGSRTNLQYQLALRVTDGSFAPYRDVLRSA